MENIIKDDLDEVIEEFDFRMRLLHDRIDKIEHQTRALRQGFYEELIRIKFREKFNIGDKVRVEYPIDYLDCAPNGHILDIEYKKFLGKTYIIREKFMATEYFLKGIDGLSFHETWLKKVGK